MLREEQRWTPDSANRDARRLGDAAGPFHIGILRGGTLPRLIPQYYLYNPTRRGGYMASGRRRDSWTQGRSRDILRADEDSSEWASCAAVAKGVSSSVTSLRTPTTRMM